MVKKLKFGVFWAAAGLVVVGGCILLVGGMTTPVAIATVACAAVALLTMDAL